MSKTLRCCWCADVIGVYEPLVVLVHGKPHETSRAADQHIELLGEECYHRACYDHERRGRGSVVSPRTAAALRG